jgi:peroxiredoxin Q/BCP
MKFRSLLALMSLFSFLFAIANGEPLKVGDAAPAVTGVTETGAKLNLADVYKKQPYTLVYFYPKAETKGCTAQGCSLRDGYDELTKKGVAIVGVSLDTAEAQKAFKENHKFQFTLLADPDKTVVNAFGVPKRVVAQLNNAEVAMRQAYLIKDGKIIYTDYKGTTDKQAETILKVLAEQKG